MARTPALFNGPIDFTDPASGKQISLPLSSIYFDGSSIKAEGGLYTENQTVADPWLAYLSNSRLVVPDESPPAKPAMALTATNAGSSGNLIQITFSNFQPAAAPADTKFDAVVTEVDTYTGLKPSTIQDVLGATGGAGKQPGLVFVSAVSTDLPAPIVAGKLTGTPASLDIPKNGGGNAFTLQAKAGGADGALTTITIKDVNVPQSTFTLVATWTRTEKGIKASDMSKFSYEIQVAAPNGATLTAPAPGTITLSGGSDALALPAVKASANLVTG